MQIGYCGNVHPGKNLDEVKRSLTNYSLAVKANVCPSDPMGIGLWLSATATKELRDVGAQRGFGEWLAEIGLLPFTLNGFPFGDFHQSVVKHDVYRPTWAEPSRLEYTVGLAEIQDRILPTGVAGTISTLPLGWPDASERSLDETFFLKCAEQLRSCAHALADLEQRSGRSVVLCIEPEPGCMIDTCDDLVEFFENYLLTGVATQDANIRRHIGVCHDVCHSAVMFEDQHVAIGAYARAGIRVGKIQVSSAIGFDFGQSDRATKERALGQLKSFAEPRYLHQTSIRSPDGGIEFYEDLNMALQQRSADREIDGEWRVHFHVPIFADRLGVIGTTQTEIENCLAALKETGCNAKHSSKARKHSSKAGKHSTEAREHPAKPVENPAEHTEYPTEHFEIETYAWNVLPPEWRSESLSEGIAQEWKWFEDRVSHRTPPSN